ncbi:MAG: SPASM domain-containing protein, partial [Treponema sp.]
VLKIFGENSLEIQSVVKFSEKNKKVTKTSLFPLLEELSELLSCTQKIVFQKKSTALFKIVKENFSESTPFEIPVFIFPQSLKSKNPKSFKSRKWFKEDFCEGPGNILYVHSDGNIAPCCGFSNENSELFIGTIDNSFEKILKNAKENKMISLCFTEGLSSRIKKTDSLKGKTDNICTFCDFICTSCKK